MMTAYTCFCLAPLLAVTCMHFAMYQCIAGLQPCPGKSGCMSCQACPEGTYQDAATPGFGSLATCKPCAAGKTSAAGAKSAADCFCKFPG